MTTIPELKLDADIDIQEDLEHGESVCSLSDNTPDHAEKKFHCKYCETKFKYAQGLKSHVTKYHQVLSKEEPTEDNIHYIQIIQGSDIEFVCHYCDRRFKKEGFIQKHIRKIHPGKMTVTENKKNRCDICGNTYASVVKLRNHKRHVHYNNEEYICNFCNKSFKMRFNIKKHIKLFHPDFGGIEHAYSIKESEESKMKIKVFRSDEPEIDIMDLKYNTNKYSTSKKNPIQCQICSRILSGKSGLKRHMEEVHSVAVTKRPKPMKCWIEGCDKSFHSLHWLRLHLMKAEDDGGHNWLCEEEEYIFENFEEFIQWKEDVEENESLRYITLSAASKNDDGSFRRVYHCSRSGKYSSSGTGKRRIKVQSQGTSKIGHYCLSSMNVHCNNLGIVRCTYFKTHYGHDTSANDIMHIPIHRRDKQYIVEQFCIGVPPKVILADLHAKGGRSAFIKLKDIQNHIMLQGINEPRYKSEEIYENLIPNIEAVNKIELVEEEFIFEDEYNYENEDSYEIVESDPLTTENDTMVSDTETILHQLSRSLTTNSDTIITENEDEYKMVSETDTILSELSSSIMTMNSDNSIDCVKSLTHELKVIDGIVHIYKVDD